MGDCRVGCSLGLVGARAGQMGGLARARGGLAYFGLIIIRAVLGHPMGHGDSPGMAHRPFMLCWTGTAYLAHRSKCCLFSSFGPTLIRNYKEDEEIWMVQGTFCTIVCTKCLWQREGERVAVINPWFYARYGSDRNLKLLCT